MNELAMLLDELVADAPVGKASWTDVLARSRRIRRPHRARKPLVVVLAVALLLVLAATAVGIGVDLLTQQERFHVRRPDDPKRVGPLVEITSGDEWALIAWRSEVGICLDFAIPGNSPFGCGFPVRGAKPPTDASGSGLPTHAVAGFVSGGGLAGGDGKMTIFGVAAREVATVKVELRDGQVVDAPLYDAPRELVADVRFFIVRLQPAQPERGILRSSPVRAYNAYDRDGKLIERVVD
jgi:hypothetical protein